MEVLLSLFLASLAYIGSIGLMGESGMNGGWVSGWCGFTVLRLNRGGGGRWKGGIHVFAYFLSAEWTKKKEELAVTRGLNPGNPMEWTLVDIILSLDATDLSLGIGALGPWLEEENNTRRGLHFDLTRIWLVVKGGRVGGREDRSGSVFFSLCCMFEGVGE